MSTPTLRNRTFRCGLIAPHRSLSVGQIQLRVLELGDFDVFVQHQFSVSNYGVVQGFDLVSEAASVENLTLGFDHLVSSRCCRCPRVNAQVNLAPLLHDDFKFDLRARAVNNRFTTRIFAASLIRAEGVDDEAILGQILSERDC